MLKRYNSVICLVLSFLILFCYAACDNQGNHLKGSLNDLATATLQSFDISVTTIGVLDAARSHMVSSDIRGDASKIIFIIDDGTHVKKGDLLVKIDQTPFEDKVEELRVEVAALESGCKAKEQMLEWEKNQVEKNFSNAKYNQTLAKLEYKRLIEGDGPLQVSQYTSEVVKAKQEYEKYVAYYNELETLKKSGYSNPSELALALKHINEYKEKYESAQKTLASYKDHVYPSLKQAAMAKVKKTEADILQITNDGVVNIAKAGAILEEGKKTMDSKRAALKQAENELRKVEIRAPFDGIAILYETFREGEKRKPRIGDRVIRNQPILYLPDISSMIVRTNIREVDLHKVALTQKAVICVDAYPDVNLDGTVAFIGALATEVKSGGLGGKFFQCTININTPELRLRPGMTSRITIISDQVKDALSVPVSSVFLEDGNVFCYRFEHGMYERVAVRTGRQNMDYAEIVSGLKNGDKVSLVKPADFLHKNISEKGN